MVCVRALLSGRRRASWLSREHTLWAKAWSKFMSTFSLNMHCTKPQRTNGHHSLEFCSRIDFVYWASSQNHLQKPRDAWLRSFNVRTTFSHTMTSKFIDETYKITIVFVHFSCNCTSDAFLFHTNVSRARLQSHFVVDTLYSLVYHFGIFDRIVCTINACAFVFQFWPRARASSREIENLYCSFFGSFANDWVIQTHLEIAFRLECSFFISFEPVESIILFEFMDMNKTNKLQRAAHYKMSSFETKRRRLRRWSDNLCLCEENAHQAETGSSAGCHFYWQLTQIAFCPTDWTIPADSSSIARYKFVCFAYTISISQHSVMLKE